MTTDPGENPQLAQLKTELEGFLAEEAAADVGPQGWITAYEALTELLERNLRDQIGVLEDLPESARRYMERANVVILQEELETFRERLEFWRTKAQD